MLKLPHWNRLLATGLRIAPLRRSHQLTADLVAQGQHARDQLGTVLAALVDTSRHGTEEMRRIVRSGADRHLSGLGLVTKGDLAALEHRLRSASAPKTTGASKQTPRRATAEQARRSRSHAR